MATSTLGTPSQERRQREPGQREQARLLANTVRIHRSAIKRALAAGTMSLVDYLDGEVYEDEYMAGVYVEDILLASRRLGDTLAHKIMDTAGLYPSARFGRLTQRQRDALLAQVILRIPHPSKGRR